MPSRISIRDRIESLSTPFNMTVQTARVKEVYEGNNRHGPVYTPYGIVYTWTQGEHMLGGKLLTDIDVTLLEFVYNRKLYSRWINKSYTSRGLVTAANRFAKDVAGGKVATNNKYTEFPLIGRKLLRINKRDE